MQKPKSQPTPQKPPTFASAAERLKWCRSALVAGTLVAANAGCPGAQVRPEPGRCPADAIKAMKEHGYPDGAWLAWKWVIAGEEGMRPLPRKHGLVEAVVVPHSKGETMKTLPNGTRIFGEVWPPPQPGYPTDGAVRFYRARLPDETEFPVCIQGSDTGLIDEMAFDLAGWIQVGQLVRGWD